MSEETKELKFVRLRYLPDDLVGYVTYMEECIVIEFPLRVEIDTYFDEGRQILSMQEYLPQTIIGIKEIEFSLNDILLVSPVKPEFVEQYEYVRDFFYNNESTIKKPKTKTSPSEQSEEKLEKVVSILEAMQAKKDKPVH